MKSTSIAGMAFAVLLGLLSLLWASMANAHAEFRGSVPAQDSLLDGVPAVISLEFSEQVGVLALTWHLPGGREVAAVGAAGATTLTVQPPPDAGRGTYVLQWRVASADGHPVGGALVFSVGEVTGSASPGAEGSATASATVAFRAAMVAALVLSVGAAVFQTLFAPVPPGVARLATPLAVLVMPLGVLWLGAEGLDRLGLPFGAFFQDDVWGQALASPVARTVALAMVAAALALGALLMQWRLAAFSAWALAALSFTLSGHALSAPSWTALPLTFLHGAALLFWVGSLLPLAAAMIPLPPAGRAKFLRRFSRPAVAAVLVLVGSGAGLILMRPLAVETLATPWARLLGVKLALVAAMLALALWHRARAVPQLERGQAAPVARTIGLEAALGLVVLCLAMGFRLAPPPTTPLADPPSVHIHTTKAMADVALSATPPGAVSVSLMLADADFVPFDPQEVRLDLTDPVAGIGPLTVQAKRDETGVWSTAPVTLPSPGPWEVRLMLLISDFEQVTLTGTLATIGMGQP
ncbi:MAG: copper resistance protein CopC/CopD [Tabrizicola sp.]|nr:copper resistance protein CopC/CopD [Tabrizicola sp.]